MSTSIWSNRTSPTELEQSWRPICWDSRRSGWQRSLAERGTQPPRHWKSRELRDRRKMIRWLDWCESLMKTFSTLELVKTMVGFIIAVRSCPSPRISIRVTKSLQNNIFDYSITLFGPIPSVHISFCFFSYLWPIILYTYSLRIFFPRWLFSLLQHL